MADQPLTHWHGISAWEAEHIAEFLAALNEASRKTRVTLDPSYGGVFINDRSVGCLRFHEREYRLGQES